MWRKNGGWVRRGKRDERGREGGMEKPSCPTSQLESVSSFLRSHRWCRSCWSRLRRQSKTFVAFHRPSIRNLCFQAKQISIMQVWCKTFIPNVQFCKTIIRTEYILPNSPSKYIKSTTIYGKLKCSSFISLYTSSQKMGKEYPGGPVKSNIMNIMWLQSCAQ